MTRLIGVDWSAERFRAWRFDDRGAVLDRRESRDGLRRAAKRGYEETLLRHVGAWLEPGTAIAVSSAVPDRRVWIETPLLPAPVSVGALLDAAVRERLGEATVLALPGIASRVPGANDVMRREALLALGASGVPSGGGHERDGQRLVVVPGRRSRWIRVSGGRVVAFRTGIGGELLELLLDGAFGRVMPSGGTSDDAAFFEGVEQGYRSRHVVTDLFAVRATALLDERDPSLSRTRLTGLIIGNEIREAEVALEATGEALTLIGEEAVLAPYVRALRHLGTTVGRVGIEAAARAGFEAILETLPHEAPSDPPGYPARTDPVPPDTAADTSRARGAARTARPLRGWQDAFDELPLLALLPAAEFHHGIATAARMVEAGFRILIVSLREGHEGRADEAPDADALATIRRLSDAVGTRVCIGVRDASTLENAHAAIEAGARVVVASGVDAALARHCAERAVPWVPSVATVTDATRAIALGARALLLDPGDTIGPRAVQALRRGLPPGTPLVPAGALAARTLLPYAAAGASGAVADATLVDASASRADGVAAARTFVRTWRRIERSRRVLASGGRVSSPSVPGGGADDAG